MVFVSIFSGGQGQPDGKDLEFNVRNLDADLALNQFISKLESWIEKYPRGHVSTDFYWDEEKMD